MHAALHRLVHTLVHTRAVFFLGGMLVPFAVVCGASPLGAYPGAYDDPMYRENTGTYRGAYP